jgi:hypothetical protein
VEGGPARVTVGDYRFGAADSAGGAVEGRTHAVAAGGKRVPAEAGDVGARNLFGRIGEHHRRHDAVRLGLGPRPRHQLLGFGHDGLDVADPGEMVRARQLDVPRAGNVLRHVSGVRHVDRHLVDPMEDHDGNPDRRKQRPHVDVEHHPQQRAGGGGRRRQALGPPPRAARRVVPGE